MPVGGWKNCLVLCSIEFKVNILTFKARMEEVLPASLKPNHPHVLLISLNSGQFKCLVPTALTTCSRYYKGGSPSLPGMLNQIAHELLISHNNNNINQH